MRSSPGERQSGRAALGRGGAGEQLLGGAGRGGGGRARTAGGGTPASRGRAVVRVSPTCRWFYSGGDLQTRFPDARRLLQVRFESKMSAEASQSALEVERLRQARALPAAYSMQLVCVRSCSSVYVHAAVCACVHAAADWGRISPHAILSAHNTASLSRPSRRLPPGRFWRTKGSTRSTCLPRPKRRPPGACPRTHRAHHFAPH